MIAGNRRIRDRADTVDDTGASMRRGRPIIGRARERIVHSESLKSRLYSVIVAVAAFGPLACTDILLPPANRSATLQVRYSAAYAARMPMTNPDRVHIRVTSADAVLYDDAMSFAPGGNDVRVRIGLNIVRESQIVEVLLELLEGPRVVSRGVETVTLNRGSVASASVLADGLADNLSLVNGRTCYLTPAGEAYCWGDSWLGDGGTTGSTQPVRVAGGHRFVAIDAGLSHTCALKGDGEAWCWGFNGAGQLGDGTKASSGVPQLVSGSLHFKTITAGARHTCALAADGEGYCWGNNSFGELGSVGTEALTPTAVGGGLRFEQMRVGFLETCGLSGGVPYCWGRSLPGSGNPSGPTPTREPGAVTFASLTPGNRNRCGVTPAGAAYCWSPDPTQFGQIGNGMLTPTLTPEAVAGGHTFRIVVPTRSNASVFSNHTCGIATDGRAYCWGLNRVGQLGANTGSSTCASGQFVPTTVPLPCSPVPVPVSGNHRFASISLGWESACGLTEEGRVYCWGYGYMGALGQGDLLNRATPSLVAEPIPAPVATSVTLNVASQTVAVGDAVVASAYQADEQGRPIPALVLWDSSDTTIVSIDNRLGTDGIAIPLSRVLHAHARGAAIITATAGGLTRSATIAVN